MDGWMQIVGTLVTGLVSGGGIGAFLKHKYDAVKLRGDQILAEDAQTTKTYEAIVTRLEARVVKLEGDHQKCTEDHMKAIEQIGELKGRVAELSSQVSRLQKEAGNARTGNGTV